MLIVAYDGTHFHGFAAQPGQRTVAGVLAGAIEVVAGSPVVMVCAGRTDAGVHAWGQVVHVDLPGQAPDPSLLARACNRMLAPEVVVRSVAEVPRSFDARASASSRRYKYLLYDDNVASPFMARRAWHVRARLDLGAMEKATYPLLGEHDFTSFCRRPKRAPGRGPVAGAGGGETRASLVRRVIEAHWSRSVPEVLCPTAALPEPGLLCFDIEASSFCHQMVRSVVSILVDVGVGRRKAQDVARVLEARDRSVAAPPAPPYGLYLWRVSYDRS